jgi:hypothetical protein
MAENNKALREVWGGGLIPATLNRETLETAPHQLVRFLQEVGLPDNLRITEEKTAALEMLGAPINLSTLQSLHSNFEFMYHNLRTIEWQGEGYLWIGIYNDVDEAKLVVKKTDQCVYLLASDDCEAQISKKLDREILHFVNTSVEHLIKCLRLHLDYLKKIVKLIPDTMTFPSDVPFEEGEQRHKNAVRKTKFITSRFRAKLKSIDENVVLRQPSYWKEVLQYLEYGS